MTTTATEPPPAPLSPEALRAECRRIAEAARAGAYDAATIARLLTRALGEAP